jgi:hypothetical protein
MIFSLPSLLRRVSSYLIFMTSVDGTHVPEGHGGVYRVEFHQTTERYTYPCTTQEYIIIVVIIISIIISIIVKTYKPTICCFFFFFLHRYLLPLSSV